MNTPQQSQPLHQTIVVQSQGQTTAGVVGLCISILGWLTCGLLSIPGAIVSFVGLFGEGKKAAAIIGVILSLPGSAFFFIVGMGLIGGMLMSTEAVEQARKDAAERQANAAQMQIEISEASADPSPTEEKQEPDPQSNPLPKIQPELEQENQEIEEFIGRPEAEMQPEPELTTEPEPEPVSEPQPESKPVYRTFSDASGKFSVEAEVVTATADSVKLRRKDNGQEITLRIEQLSQADQEWIRENYP